MNSSPVAGVSFLAPASLALLPVLALAWVSGKKEEAYEWTQFSLTAVCFAAGFLSALLFGPWRKGLPAILGALMAIAGVAVASAEGLSGSHWLFLVAGTGVALGYRSESHAPLEVITLAFSSILSFWACSQLLWWEVFDITFDSWLSRGLYLILPLILVVLLRRVDTRDASASLRSSVWIHRIVDVIAVVVLAAAAFRTSSLSHLPDFKHHWGVYVASADLVREGHLLLGEVPSQYGFLSTLILAYIPAADRWTAVFWLNGTLVFISSIIVFFGLTSLFRDWWWRLFSAVLTLSTVALLCGRSPLFTGSMPYPSVGAMRFIWVYVLLGFLLCRQFSRARSSDPSSQEEPAMIWIGSVLWMLGVLWSAESAAYTTAIWFPAASILSMKSAPSMPDGPLDKLIRLLRGIGRTLSQSGACLAIAILAVYFYYRLAFGRSPMWSGYSEYATAFSNGFGSLPIDPHCEVWALLLLHAAFLAGIVSTDIDRCRTSCALLWAGWGALWSVSSYFISRSAANSLLNLTPVLLLAITAFAHAVRNSERESLARPWLWLIMPPFLSAVVWLVLVHPKILVQGVLDYSCEPNVAKLLRPMPEELSTLIERCRATKSGPFAVALSSSLGIVDAKHTVTDVTFLPIQSPALFFPLPAQMRFRYADIYTHNGQVAGWLITPINRRDAELRWIFEYVTLRYTTHIVFSAGDWEAVYLTPRPHDAALPKDLNRPSG